MKSRSCTAVLILGVLASAESATAQTKSTTHPVTDLGSLVSPSTSSSAKRINSSGQVVGWSYLNSTSTIGHAVLWNWDSTARTWGIQDLGTLPGLNGSNAQGITEMGWVAGTAYLDDVNGNNRAFFWEQGTMIDLGELCPGESAGKGMNDTGQVVGWADFDGTGLHRAALWERHWDQGLQRWMWGVQPLGALPGGYSSAASCINSSGQIAGASSVDETNTCYRACLWDQGTKIDLGELGGGNGTNALFISDSGQVVGWWHPGALTRACVWDRVEGGWSFRDLGTLPGGGGSQAYGVNNFGQIVGYSGTPLGTHAFLYDGVSMRDVNEMLPVGSGWVLTAAYDINDDGQIVGHGINPQGYDHAFLMDTATPVGYSYTSTGSAVAIREPKGKTNVPVSKAMTLTDTYTILDLSVAINLTHSNYADLKIELIGPDGRARVLCNAGGITGSDTKRLVFDDEAAAGTIQPVQPLSHYENKSTQGTWTLRVTDTVSNKKTGTLTSWTLTVVPQTP